MEMMAKTKTKTIKKAEDYISLSFRVAPEMWAAMKAEAAKNDRTLAGEAVHRLRQSLAMQPAE
jgi:hypothetical protein